MSRNEISYYQEIMDFISSQLKSNFKANCNRELFIYWKIGELSTKLTEIINENPNECACLINFAKKTLPLNLDIFAVITDGIHFEILILEIKKMGRVGLKEWSQLVGYCIVSDAHYGLLINIDAGGSTRLNDILQNDKSISTIIRTKKDSQIEHILGLMQWNSLTHNFEYTNIGSIKSLTYLTELIISNFNP